MVDLIIFVQLGLNGFGGKTGIEENGSFYPKLLRFSKK